MVKRLAFVFRFPLIPSWALVNIHTSIGVIRAEYVPGSEVDLGGGQWSYDFKIIESDIPSPGDFTCDDLVEPYITAYNPNASCGANYFTGLELVDTASVPYFVVAIPNQCGGKAVLALVPAEQVRTTEA